MVIAGLIFLLVFGLLTLTQFICCESSAADRLVNSDRVSGLMPELVCTDSLARNTVQATGPPGIWTTPARLRARAEMSGGRQQSVDEYDLHVRSALGTDSDF